MNAAQHAGRILAAWNIADSASFERELENALHSCSLPGPVNHLECEQREVLESVVERLRFMQTPTCQPANGDRHDFTRVNFDRHAARQSLPVGFALLEHLCQRTA